MKIAVASDHAGPPLKEEVREDSKLRTFTSA
jgi:ribose 5-phosphate isomerase RpiB